LLHVLCVVLMRCYIFTLNSILKFCFEVFEASFNIITPARHFSYSSGNFSSMYILILDFACCLRIDRSPFTVPLDTYNICAISLWLYPWLLSSLDFASAPVNYVSFLFLIGAIMVNVTFNLNAQLNLRMHVRESPVR
jgi:hypothetical protein